MVEPKRGALSAAGRSVKEMNERGAVQLLCNRAWRNMAATRLKNQTSARPRCLCCALRAHIQETECAERVFCGTRCQSHLRGVQQFFRLGMKRGAAALEDEAPQIFAWPEIFPDDVLCVLLLWAYRGELRSVAEFDELWAMRRLGRERNVGAARQFKRVIDECVVPQITRLSRDILRKIYVHTLRRFVALREITFFPDRTRSDEDGTEELTLAQFEGEVFDSLARVTALTIATGATPTLPQLERVLPQLTFFAIHTLHGAPDMPYAAMPALREVVFRGVKLAKWAESPPPSLERLIIQGIHEGGVMPLMPSLRQLALDWYSGVDEVAQSCPGLEVLRLGHESPPFQMLQGLYMQHLEQEAESVASMTTLRALDIRNSSLTFDDALLVSLPNLRSLLVRGSSNNNTLTAFSDEALASLVLLESLALDHKLPPTLSGASVATLVNLTWLSLIACPLAVDFSALVQLRVLDLSLRSPPVADAIGHLPALHTLILRYNKSVSPAHLRALGAHLLTLSLSGNAEMDDETLSALVALRVLEVGQTGGSISSRGMAALVSLDTLYLGDQSDTFEEKLLAMPNLATVRSFGGGRLAARVAATMRARGVTIVRERGVVLPYPLPAIWREGASDAFRAEWDRDPNR